MRRELHALFKVSLGSCLQLFEIGQGARLRWRIHARDTRLRPGLWQDCGSGNRASKTE